ncbi:unnamed protein product [Lactuca saligna]|uniref:Uncharacterized protein n=1 Tax=Lactuca saligna TaxID=75948 RepID=A0AA35YTN8_LACSI|nr:unnamed protein product [Lactuca saligna]
MFGIYLRCLTGRSVGLDKGRLEVYAMEKKSSKPPKKKQNKEVVVSKPEENPIKPESVDPTKEAVPSKTGVFKRIKKIAHNSRSSSERSPSFSPSMIRKPHVTQKSVVLREVPIPVSPFVKK